MAGIDEFLAARSREWISGAVEDAKAYGGTTGPMTTAGTFNGSVVLWNPAGSGVDVYLYGMQVMVATAGIFVTVAHITVDPGFSVVAGQLSKRRGSVATSQAKMEYSTNDNTGAPAAANATDTLLTAANQEFPYFGGNVVDTFLTQGTGIRIYLPSPGQAVQWAVNLDWVEF